MWFQALLLSTLSLAEYGRTLLGLFGRCNRKMQSRPRTLHVRANSIEGLWMAAFLQKQGSARQVVLVEEPSSVEVDALYGVGDEEWLTVDSAFRAVGINIDWGSEARDLVLKRKEKPKEDKDWAIFSKKTAADPKEDRSIKNKRFVGGALAPAKGWGPVCDRLRAIVDEEEWVPDHEFVYLLDARDDHGTPSQRRGGNDVEVDDPTLVRPDFRDMIRMGLRLIGVLPIEIDMLGVDRILESMAEGEDDEEEHAAEEEDAVEEADDEEADDEEADDAEAKKED